MTNAAHAKTLLPFQFRIERVDRIARGNVPLLINSNYLVLVILYYVKKVIYQTFCFIFNDCFKLGMCFVIWNYKVANYLYFDI